MMPRHKRRNGRRRYRLNPKLLPTAGLTLLAVGMVVVVFMMLMPGGSISVFNQPTPTPTAQPTAEPTEVPTQAPTPTPQIYNEVRVRAAGDIMVHDDELLSAKQDDGSYDFTSFFGEIADKPRRRRLHHGQSGDDGRRSRIKGIHGLSQFPYANVAVDRAQGHRHRHADDQQQSLSGQVFRWTGRDA